MLMEFGLTADRMVGCRIHPAPIRANSSQLPGRYRPDFLALAEEGCPILVCIWDARERL